MIKRLSNEDGITLIELLATLTIISFICLLLYNVLLNGFDYSKKSQDTVSLQQEMNIIISNITKIHESCAAYDIVMDQNPGANKIELISRDSACAIVTPIELSNDDYEYSFFNTKNNTEVLFSSTTQVKTVGDIVEGKEHDLYIKIIIKNKNQPSKTYEVKTIISRL